MDENDTAALLVGARRSGKMLEALDSTPASVAQAHAIQDRVSMMLGESVGGFKANAPPGEPPVRGVIYADKIYSSPMRIAPREAPLRGVEGEIAFRFLHDLPPRDAEYTRAEVTRCVAALAAIEVVSGRLKDPLTRPALEQLADALNNGGLVLGPDLADWTLLDIANLPVTAWVNDEVVVQQVGGAPLGDPLAVAIALVNMMRRQNGVKAGQVVTTGSCIGIRFLQPGDRFKVAFDGLGEAELVFAA